MAADLSRVTAGFLADPERFIKLFPQLTRHMIHELIAMHDNALEQLAARDAKITQLEDRIKRLGLWTTCSQCGEHDSDDYYFAPSGLCCDCEEKRLADK